MLEKATLLRRKYNRDENTSEGVRVMGRRSTDSIEHWMGANSVGEKAPTMRRRRVILMNIRRSYK
jgi:hypothetical protein